MKKMLFSLVLLATATLSGQTAMAADKITPATFICAEFDALISATNQAPIFEGLQLDGYAAAKDGVDAADPSVLGDILVEIAGQCATKPADTVVPMWQKVRKNLHPDTNGAWSATKSTCKQFNNDRDNGEGFVVWLDGYNRQKTGKDASILGSQESYDAYFAACKANPDKLMLDVIRELAK